MAVVASLCAAALLAGGAQGHGFLSEPKSRNYVAYYDARDGTTYCPQ